MHPEIFRCFSPDSKFVHPIGVQMGRKVLAEGDYGRGGCVGWKGSKGGDVGCGKHFAAGGGYHLGSRISALGGIIIWGGLLLGGGQVNQLF